MSNMIDPVFGETDTGTHSGPGADETTEQVPGQAMSSSSSSSVSSAVRVTSTAAVTRSTISTTVSSSAVATPNPATPTTSLTSSTSSSILSSAVASSTTTRSIITSSAVTSSTISTTSSTSSTSSSTRTSTTSSSTRTTSTSTRSRHTTSTSSTQLSSSSSATQTSSSSTATASSTQIAANTKSGIGGSGLSVGALVGIIIGCIVALILIAVLATRQIRKKARADKRMRRGSMFEWPQTGLEHDPYEKPRYEPPSESYAMADAYGNNAAQTVPYPTNETVSYPVNEPVYAAVPAESSTPLSYVERHNPQPSYRNSFQNVPMDSAYPAYPPQAQTQYPAQGLGQYPPNFAGVGGAGAAVGVGAGAAMAATPAAPLAHGGLASGMWASVKVGFVRSLEDELAVTPGQRLYVHAVYDDDWCLCEDDTQRKGVVPVSCLEPFRDSLAPAATGTGLVRSGSGQSVSAKSERHSSLLPPGRQ